MEQNSWSQLAIADVEIRPSDRMQYITGTYTDYNDYYIDANKGPQPQFADNVATNCFIAKVTARGEIQDSIYLKTLDSDWSYFYWDDEMKCNALAIVPKTDNIVAVGSRTENYYLTYRDPFNTPSSISAGMDSRSRGMLLYTTPDLRLISIKVIFGNEIYTSC